MLNYYFKYLLLFLAEYQSFTSSELHKRLKLYNLRGEHPSLLELLAAHGEIQTVTGVRGRKRLGTSFLR